MRRPSKTRPSLVVVLLLPLLLLLVVGFEPGPQTSPDEATRAAYAVPKLSDLLSHPTVHASAAGYDPATDSWRVVLTEEASKTEVAGLTVADDTREVGGVKIYPVADVLTYPKTSEAEAIKVAEADPKVQGELANRGPYTSDAEYDAGEWSVHFRVNEGGTAGGLRSEDGTKEVAQVGVNDTTWQLDYTRTGDQVGWQMARGEYGSYGKQANYWYVWGPLALLFALAFWRSDKLYSLRNLDILVLLSFLVSHGFFRAGESYPAVLLWYPPLVYLLVRTLLMGFGIGERVERTSDLPTPVLFALGTLCGAFVLALNLDSRVIDVGYAGVVGADRILHGYLPYGNMPSDVANGDTYGPLNYILYIPSRLVFGWSGSWDYLPAAHALTAVAFIGGALALIFAGRKYAGNRGAAALLVAWCSFPYTLYSTNNNTNDVVVAALAAGGLLLAGSPLARGVSVAAGFSVKLFPLLLVPLWAFHGGLKGRRRASSLVDFALGAMGVVLLSFWVLALNGDPAGGIMLFLQKTLTFQGGRETPWTIFAQIPWLHFLQPWLTGLVVVLAFVVALVPKKRTVRRLSALSAALVIAFQLVINYWFYTYVIWFEPFVFLALLPATNEKTALDGVQREEDQGPVAAKDDEFSKRGGRGKVSSGEGPDLSGFETRG